jgi:hypothetical protein
MKPTEEQTGKALLSAPPKIMTCACKHEFQDSEYGIHRRVHNPCQPPNKGLGIAHRCTVCGHVKH